MRRGKRELNGTIIKYRLHHSFLDNDDVLDFAQINGVFVAREKKRLLAVDNAKVGDDKRLEIIVKNFIENAVEVKSGGGEPQKRKRTIGRRRHQLLDVGVRYKNKIRKNNDAENCQAEQRGEKHDPMFAAKTKHRFISVLAFEIFVGVVDRGKFGDFGMKLARGFGKRFAVAVSSGSNNFRFYKFFNHKKLKSRKDEVADRYPEKT